MRIFPAWLSNFAARARAITSTQEMLKWISTAKGESGYISDDDALQISTVFACNRVLATSIGQLPCILYERVKTPYGDGKKRAEKHPLYRILKTKPNPFQHATYFHQSMTHWLVNDGNHFSQIIRNRRGDVMMLNPLQHATVEGKITSDLSVEYKVITKDSTVILQQDEMLHQKAFGKDRLMGMGVLEYAAKMLNQTRSLNERTTNMLQKGLAASAVLEHPGELGDAARNHLRESIKGEAFGSTNEGNLLILEEGMKVHPLSANNDEFQYVDLKKYSRSEICSWYGIPPHLVGDLERATFSNIEQQSLDFLVHCLGGWLQSIKLTYDTQLLTEKEQERYYTEFLTQALLKTDTKTRFESYKIALDSGWKSINGVLALENEDPIEHGDIHYRPLNMVPLGQNSNEVPASSDSKGQKDEAKPLPKRSIEALLQPLAASLSARIERRIEKVAVNDKPSWEKVKQDSIRDIIPLFESALIMSDQSAEPKKIAEYSEKFVDRAIATRGSSQWRGGAVELGELLKVGHEN